MLYKLSLILLVNVQFYAVKAQSLDSVPFNKIIAYFKSKSYYNYLSKSKKKRFAKENQHVLLKIYPKLYTINSKKIDSNKINMDFDFHKRLRENYHNSNLDLPLLDSINKAYTVLDWPVDIEDRLPYNKNILYPTQLMFIYFSKNLVLVVKTRNEFPCMYCTVEYYFFYVNPFGVELMNFSKYIFG